MGSRMKKKRDFLSNSVRKTQKFKIKLNNDEIETIVKEKKPHVGGTDA